MTLLTSQRRDDYMQAIPYLTFKSSIKALEFYKKVGATDIYLTTADDEAFADQLDQMPIGDRSPAEFVLNASFSLFGQRIYCSDTWDARDVNNTDTAVSFEFNVNDDDAVDAVKRFFTLVAENGGDVAMPLEPAEWTSLFGQVSDPFDISWIFNGIDG